VGITDLSDKQVVERQRLGPGEMLIADPELGRSSGRTKLEGWREQRRASPRLQ